MSDDDKIDGRINGPQFEPADKDGLVSRLILHADHRVYDIRSPDCARGFDADPIHNPDYQ